METTRAVLGSFARFIRSGDFSGYLNVQLGPNVQLGSQNVHIQSSGVVRASQSVNIVPQVGGQIVSLADSLQPGRRFRRGELIAKISE